MTGGGHSLIEPKPCFSSVAQHTHKLQPSLSPITEQSATYGLTPAFGHAVSCTKAVSFQLLCPQSFLKRAPTVTSSPRPANVSQELTDPSCPHSSLISSILPSFEDISKLSKSRRAQEKLKAAGCEDQPTYAFAHFHSLCFLSIVG